MSEASGWPDLVSEASGGPDLVSGESRGPNLASGASGGPDLTSDWETHICQALLLYPPLILDVHVHRQSYVHA